MKVREEELSADSDFAPWARQSEQWQKGILG